MRIARFLLLAVVGTAWIAPDTSACPFCSSQGQTLSGEVTQADLIVLGSMTNARRDPNDFTKGETTFVIDNIIKPHEYLSGKKTLTIPRYVEPPTDGTKFLVFASLYARPEEFPMSAVASSAILGNPAFSQLDPYRGEAVKPDSKLPEYLKGAIAVRQKDAVSKLRYFFEYLDAPELVVGADALTEYGNADYKDVRTLAKTLPAGKIVKWLKDPNTPPSRFGLYGLFLGHCGTKDDAKAVRAVLDDPARLYSSGLDGMLAAYVMLDKPTGWAYVMDILKDPKKEFPIRYAGLKVLRFFWEFRPDLVSKEEILVGMRHLIEQSDMADLPIEDLRKWGSWDQMGYVLQFAGKESHNKIPIIRRAILRFALSAPATDKEAAAYVEQARKADPERVKDVEQLLKDEQPKTPASAQQPAATPPGGGS